MEILIIGYSSIAKRKMIPALLTLKNIKKIHLATHQRVFDNIIPMEMRGEVYNDYGEAISKCRVDLVYVSLPNSMHVEWIRRSLDKNLHVIVDKPAVIELTDAEEIAMYARRKKRCLAEANVWMYHPLMVSLKKMIDEENDPPLSIIAIFTSPPLELSNFRYDSKLGGGIILDRASYAASCGRIFYHKKPVEIISKVNKNGIDTSLGLMMAYNHDSVFQAFFSLEAEYKNSISVIGRSYYYEAERIFTPPSDIELVINAKRSNKSEQIITEKGDSFALFVQDVIRSIETNSFQHFTEIMLEDAQVIEAIKRSAKEG